MTNTSQRSDVYSRVTARIVADLEQGVRPWCKRWAAQASNPLRLPLRHNGTPYRGINILLLWAEAQHRGYAAPIWMTYRQALTLGAQVRKGETGSLVVFADRVTRTEMDEDGDETARETFFMKGYTVFNVEQIDNLPDMYRPGVAADRTQSTPQLQQRSEDFFGRTGAHFQHGGNRAFYAPGPDVIRLPEPGAFVDAEAYAATKAHELIHWTGHPSRLARDFGGRRFGDSGYALEELVAELGAAFLCADLGVTVEPRADHATYLASWLKALKGDKRLIFSAAMYAQRAADFLHQAQQELARRAD